MNHRTLIASVSGLVVGMMSTAAMLPTFAAQQTKAEPNTDITTVCKSNGTGGFRACTVKVDAPLRDINRVRLALVINGRFEFGAAYDPRPRPTQPQVELRTPNRPE